MRGNLVSLLAIILLLAAGGVSCTLADGTGLYQSGDYQGALEAFTQDLGNATGRDQAPILNNIGTCWMALGDPEQAAGYYEQAVAADQAYGRGWINLGVVQEKLGKYEEALKSYDAVTDADPEHFSEAMVKKGTLLSALGRSEEALAAFNAGIPGASARTAADLYTGIGAVSFMLKRPAEAEEAFVQAIDADPEGAVMAWTNLGVLQISQGRYTDAKEAFETAISHDSEGISPARSYLANLEAMTAGNVTGEESS